MQCQKCRTPLKLAESIQDLDSAAASLLVGSTRASVHQYISKVASPADAAKQARYEEAKRAVGAVKQPGGAVSDQDETKTANTTAMSFLMLSDSEVLPARGQPDGPKTQSVSAHADDGNNSSPANDIERAMALFEILSARSDIDHPICVECTEMLLSFMKERLDAALEERDEYIALLKSLNTSTPSQTEVESAQQSLQKAQRAEQDAKAQLSALETEKASLDEELANLEQESQALDREEEIFWQKRNAIIKESYDFQFKHDPLQAAYEYEAQELEQLQRTDVYNDALRITSDGRFATINGLRLGRLPPSHPVEWKEINAAWGYTALLLATVADKFGCIFTGYRVRPIGSASRVEQLGSGAGDSKTRSSDGNTKPKAKPLDLFSSGDIPLAGALIHRRINQGMVAFLECLWQLCQHVERRMGRQLQHKVPYTVKGDKIGSDEHGFKSIKLNTSSDEDWTQACKRVLTCCKYLLVAVRQLDASKYDVIA